MKKYRKVLSTFFFVFFNLKVKSILIFIILPISFYIPFSLRAATLLSFCLCTFFLFVFVVFFVYVLLTHILYVVIFYVVLEIASHVCVLHVAFFFKFQHHMF